MAKPQNKLYEVKFFGKIMKESPNYETTTREYYIYLKDIILTKAPKIAHKRFKVLEAGCGTGVFGFSLLKLNPNLKVTGVDITPEMVDLINKKRILDYHAILGDLEDENLFGENYFDVILCPFILHHFPALSGVFYNLTKWLKTGGLIICLEPNGSNPVSKLSKIIRHLIELIFGKEFIIDHKLATPNETDHSVTTYMKFLKNMGYKILFFDTNHFAPKKVKLLSIRGLKNIMYKISNCLPKPFKGSGIAIIAKKNS